MDFKHHGRFPWLRQIWYSVRHRGLLNTCAMGMMEWKKERQLGINTFGIATPEPHAIGTTQCEGGHFYQPSSSVLFEKAMHLLPFNFTDKVFLDVGSGKGRALILAAEAGFRKVIGVEHAAELNAQAHVNIEKVRHRFPHTEFVLIEDDALTSPIAPDTDVIYLFNPFDKRSLEMYLRHVKKHFAYDRQLHLIYVHPVHQCVFEREIGPPVAVLHNRKGMPEAALFRLH